MEYRPLGRTGMMVSVPCLGTMTFGWEPQDWGSTEEEAASVMAKAYDLGINFFDTADVYARGASEEILGRLIRGKRNELVIATKCHGKMHDTDPNAWGNSRRHVMDACDASLKRLGIDCIDLYQIHRPQPAIPIDETLRALDDLIRQGKVRSIGCSTFGGWQLAEAHYVAKCLGINGFVSEQPPYNLLDRRIERELLPFCRTYDWGVIPWSPLAGGQLSGKYLDAKPEKARYGASDPGKRVSEESTAKVKLLAEAATQFGMSMTELSLGWVTSQPGITTPIIGARSPEQLEQAAKACLTPIPAELSKLVDDIVQPGGHIVDYYRADFGKGLRPNC